MDSPGSCKDSTVPSPLSYSEPLMLLSTTILLALGGLDMARGAAVKRQDDTFQCKEGYVLTSYTSAGVGTCTKIEGSSIVPGYSAQTVVVVGLVSGLAGLLTTCLPLGKFFYRSGVGYFGADNGQQWHNAFPRTINEQSAVGSHLQQALNSSFEKTFSDLQAHHFDSDAFVSYENNATSTSATITHSGFQHTHAFHVVPHNETHDTWKTNYDIAPIVNTLTKKSATWGGARIVVNNALVDGEYNPVGIDSGTINQVAHDQVTDYLFNVEFKSGSRLCSVVGSFPTRHRHFATFISIASRDGYGGPYEASTCNLTEQDPLTNDEL